jgi:linoleoyl-CoA desaturase
MQVIRFKGTNNTDKLFWKTLKANVNQYFNENNISPKGNINMWLKTAAMYTMYLAPLMLLFMFSPNAFIAILCVIVMGIGKAGIGMSVMHDGLHGSYSNQKWVNRLAGASMYMIGSNVFNWKIQHNIFHHAYTNIQGLDEDIQTRWIIRLCEHTPLKPIHKFQHIYALFLYSLMTFSMLIGDITQLVGYNKTGLTRLHKANPTKELLIALGVKFVYLFVMIGVPILITDYTWWQVLIGFVIMHLVAGFIFSIVFQMAHIMEDATQPTINENGVTPNEWAIHQLLTTVNFAPKNRILNWYVGGLNFQIEHHLFPNICHLHYKNISPIVARTAREFGAPYNSIPTLRTAVVSHNKRLKELGGHL